MSEREGRRAHQDEAPSVKVGVLSERIATDTQSGGGVCRHRVGGSLMRFEKESPGIHMSIPCEHAKSIFPKIPVGPHQGGG